MAEYALVAAQTLLALLLAPALTGFIRLLKARLQGRQGPSIRQPYLELRKLFAKEIVVSQTASWIFRVAPYVAFGTTVVVASLVPLVVVSTAMDSIGDLFSAVYLLLLGTFALALAGLDTGSAFGGMGSSRAMTVVALTEPTVALSIFALALTADSTNLGEIVLRTLAEPARVLGPGHVLAFAALLVVTLAEAGRLPVDNPATHLELTMIHEAMVLEYSGPYLALVEWANSLKLFVFLALAANLFVPWGIATARAPLPVLLGVVALVGKIAVLGVFVAVLETRVAKLRLFRVPELLSASFVLALLAVMSTFFTR